LHRFSPDSLLFHKAKREPDPSFNVSNSHNVVTSELIAGELQKKVHFV
jgi:hypothetical protein